MDQVKQKYERLEQKRADAEKEVKKLQEQFNDMPEPVTNMQLDEDIVSPRGISPPSSVPFR